MTTKNDVYNKYLVKKPWGEEYTIFKIKSKIAISLVKINNSKETSLHSHPNKKTGFIILKGKPKIQIGVHDNNFWKAKPLSILVIRPGLFHSIKNPNKSSGPVYALEFETPYKKNDLIRLKDNYGRKSKDYENKKFLKKLTKKNIILKNLQKINNFELFGKKISLQNIAGFKDISKLNDNSVCAIINGSIIDKKKQIVLNFGEIIKTKTLKILSKEYAIQKNFIVLNVE